MDGQYSLRFALLVVVSAVLFGCSSGDRYPAVPEMITVAIEPSSDAAITYNQATGKTTAIVQFIARDGAGNPFDPADLAVQLLVDGSPVDNESLLQEDSIELSSSIHLGLVLDASYSMLQHSPSAFAPMRTAAREAIVDGLALFDGRPGTFTWSVSWFAETLAFPSAAGRAWLPDDLLTIPEPGPGTATKLYAAVQRQAERMLVSHETVANGPRDHHVMIVLSDGADNYSWFDNSTFTSAGATASGAPFELNGWRTTGVDSAIASVSAHPNLTVHVLGLGSDVQDDQLQRLVTAGGGRYVKNPSSSQVGALFDAVTREFATIQNQGATMPLAPGDYEFTLRVLVGGGLGGDEYTFRFHAGDAGAGVLP